jgi:hypothetical protein
MNATKRVKTSLIQQSEILREEIKELDLQLEQIHEKRAALTQALLMATEDEKARKRISATSPEPSSLKEEVTDQDVERQALNSLTWKPFPSGKKGEWTFATDRSGNLMSSLERSRSLVNALRGQRRVSLGGYHYRMSQDGKFLHRFPAGD